LKNYPCKDTVSELTEGFLNGFRLHYTGPRFHRESSNLVSASQHKDDRRVIILQDFPSDLGTIPMGETCKVSIGKVLNGPTILPKSISFCTLGLSSSLC
jgi:hypothetical protein